MKELVLLLLTSVLAISLAQGQPLPQDSIITKNSSFGMEETLQQLRTAIQDMGINLVAEVDHAKAAADKGLELRPTHLLIFGNPQVGTNLMLADQRTGLDLPLRLLVWQDEQGQVYLTYRLPQSLQTSFDLKDQAPVLEKMDRVFEKLSQVVI